MSKILFPEIATDPEREEINMLLSGVKDRYGYDFMNYSFASLKRRLDRAKSIANVKSYPELLKNIMSTEKNFDQFLENMSISVTTMFRDPSFYVAIREQIIPMLRTFPFIKIWHAGCSTGEEVYSMAILLHEEGLLDRARIYATDFNIHSLNAAEKAVYLSKNANEYNAHYRNAGGTGSFEDYYSDGYERIKLKEFLKEKITFSYHNLVTDGVFGEMNVILCRNVLIYFDKTLQNHVLGTFAESVRHGGFLCLGSKESLNFTTAKPYFDTLDRKNRIYRRNMVTHAV